MRSSVLLYMLHRLSSSVSCRALSAGCRSLVSPQHHLIKHRGFPFPTIRAKLPRTVFPAIGLTVKGMASGGDKFPSQRQETQPGKEHVMEPTPQFTSPEYKPSNKLEVGSPLSCSHDSGFDRQSSIFFSNCRRGIHSC